MTQILPPSNDGSEVIAILQLPLPAATLATLMRVIANAYGDDLFVDFMHPLSGQYIVMVRHLDSADS